MSKEHIWYEDPMGFLSLEKAAVFIPDKDMTFVQQLNAITRLTIYFSIVVALLRKDPRVLFVSVGWMLLTVVLVEMEKTKEKERSRLLERMNVREDRRKKLCTRPTRENPYMNVTLQDYREFPNRPPACDITQSNVKRQVKQLFDEGGCRDADDIFHRANTDRPFYTTPSTSIPNDQKGFAEWLYKRGPTCKEGSGKACLRRTYRTRVE